MSLRRSPAHVRFASCVAVLALMVAAGGCARRHGPVIPPEMSGFLDDYSRLRQGGVGEVRLVYRNPKADWHAYDAVLLEPVAIWRSGRGSLAAVPEEDLLRLAFDLGNAVRTRLGEGFRLVDRAGPGVMRIRLAITAARASDPILDVVTASGLTPSTSGDGPLSPETQRFLEGAVIEGEITDAQTGMLLAQGLDTRRRGGSLAGVVDTWAEVDRAFGFWADRVCARLEARTGR